MDNKDLLKIGRVKLTGTVRTKYHKAYRLASINSGKSIGEILEEIAEESKFISQFLPKTKNAE